MNYFICKVLKPDFFKKFIKVVNEEVDHKIAEKYPNGIPFNTKEDHARLKALRHFHSIMIKDSYFNMWNNKDQMDKETVDILKESPIWEPDYFEEIFEDKREGLQNQPRIEWNGKIMKIQDIDEIVSSRTPKSKEEIDMFLSIKHETETIHRSSDSVPPSTN